MRGGVVREDGKWEEVRSRQGLENQRGRRAPNNEEVTRSTEQAAIAL